MIGTASVSDADHAGTALGARPIALAPDRRRSRVLAAAAAALAVGCQEPRGDEPRPTSVRPDRGHAQTPVPVVIAGENLGPRVFADFHDRTRSDWAERYRARLEEVWLREVRLKDDGTIAAVIPDGLTPGPYELTVVDPWGAEGSLADAYRVLAASDPTDATVRFEFGPVGPQQVGTPFLVEIRAATGSGDVAPAFNGSVALTDRTGSVVPRTVGMFASGRWSGRVEVRSTHPADALRARDAGGREGTSNDFAVAAPLPARLAFSTPPRTEAGGACSAPVDVELQDAFGNGATAQGPIAVAFAASPAAGFSIYADAACQSMIASTVVAAGATGTRVHFKGTWAARVQLDASAAGMAGASQVEQIVPGAPSVLAFATPPRVVLAGTCSPAVVVEIRDVWGNPSPVGSATPVTLTAVPASGFGFFSDSACSAPSSTAVVSVGSRRASFHFRGDAAGLVVVTASAAGFADATQAETVQGGIKSVQSGTMDMAGQTRVTVPVAAVDPSRSILWFGVRTDSLNPGDSQVRGQLATSASMEFVRNATTAPATVHWYLAEFLTSASVQRGTTPLSGAVLVTVPLATAVDLSKSFVIASYSTPGVTYGGNDFLRARLTSPTEIELSVASPPFLLATAAWQVVTLDGASVQSGDETFAAGESARTVNVNPVAVATSFLALTWYGGTGQAIGRNFLRGRLGSPTSVVLRRDATGAPADMTWYLVSLGDGSTVRSGGASFGPAVTQIDLAFAAVDRARSVAFLSGNQRGGSTPHPGTSTLPDSDNPGVGWFTAELTSSANLRLTRSVTLNQPADASWFVVEFARVP